jgi:N4-gp56 family major capsid protein
MANITVTTAANFIPEIWEKEAIFQRQEASTLLATVRTDWSGQITTQGDTVHFPKFDALTIVDKVADTALTPQTTTAGKVSITIDKHKTVPFTVEDIAAIQSQYDLVAGYGRTAGGGLAEQVDTDIATLFSDATVTQNSGSTSGGAYLDITAATILDANKQLTEAKAPRSGRWLVISPEQEATMLQIDNFVQAQAIGRMQDPSEPLINGFIGRIYGLNVLVSNALEDISAVASSSGAAAIPAHKACGVYHSEAFGLGMQQNIKVEMQRNVLAVANEVVYSMLYGIGVLEPTLAVTLRTTTEA